MTYNGGCIVIIGNPHEGFQFYGPFNGPGKAEAWAEGVMVDDGDAWSIAPLNGCHVVSKEQAEATESDVFSIPSWNHD
jgi:hypothetical protein